MNETPAIHITNLSKSFGDQSILKDVNLTVEKGEHVVIVGPSGSGKSVLLQHIIGFMVPDSGSVAIHGDEWANLSAPQQQELRYRFGVVFQKDALFEAYTLEENVAFPLEVRRRSSHATLHAHQRARELLAEVGLGEAAQRRPADCSGGMRKRVGVARALAIEPEIILYDEPTTGLDVETSLQISQLMHTVHQKYPEVTAVTITHDYLCAALVADRMFYLDKKTGTLEEITPEIETITQEYQLEEERHERIRTWIETKFEQEKGTPQQHTIISKERPGWGHSVKMTFGAFFHFIGELCLLFFEMGLPLRMKDFFSRFFHLGIFSFPIIFGAGFFIGMIALVQFYAGAGGAVESLDISLPKIFAGALFRILSPLLVGFLLAGRIGAHVSTEIGTKQFGSQFDVLKSLAISPERFFLSPIVLTLAITTPLMSLLCTWAGIFGGYFLWLSFGQSGSAYWQDAFSPTIFNIPDILYVVAKSIVIGVIIGLVSYQQGAKEKKSDEDIAQATQNAVLIAFILIILFDFVANYGYAQLSRSSVIF